VVTWNILGALRVLRGRGYETVSASEIVPGDVILLERGPMYCDMIVLQGDRIVTDESGLTGEATPVSKRSIRRASRREAYNPLQHRWCTISAGTEILEVGEGATALVLATGSFTAKGELLTDVLSYGRHKSVFDGEVYVVLALLMVECAVLIPVVFSLLGGEWVYAWFYGKWVRWNLQYHSNTTLTVALPISHLYSCWYISPLTSHSVHAYCRPLVQEASIEKYFMSNSREYSPRR
jgi:magnesium-transporting ATPase (P-type)